MSIPEDLVTYHKEVTGEIVWGLFRLQQFEQLYGTSLKTVDLLDLTASLFFRVLYELWFNSMAMSVRVLMDKNPQTVSLVQLVAKAKRHIDPVSHEGLCCELEEGLAVIWEMSKAIRTYADKVVAHRDASVFVRNGRVRLIPRILKKDFRATFNKMGELVNVLNGHFSDSEQSWTLVTRPDSDAHSLIAKLESVQAST
jgi:hypothetical protein